ncbi:MAG: hypothetical protein QM770_05590 [Tepidisphaeraceae bacterium]
MDRRGPELLFVSTAVTESTSQTNPPQPAVEQSAAPSDRPKRDAFVRVTRVVREGRLNAWRLIGAAAMAGLAIWVCREAWLEIMELAWGDQEYSHILLLPLVVAFLIWVRRLRLRHFRVSARGSASCWRRWVCRSIRWAWSTTGR